MQLLARILKAKLIPWAKAGVTERIIVARKKMLAAELPSGVEITYRKIPGRRIVVKGTRPYGNTRLVTAQWPEAGMHELEVPRFICVVDGAVNYQVGNYLIGCNAGDFILIPPRLPHMGMSYVPALIHSRIEGHPCQLLWMGSYRRGLQCWLTRYEAGRRSGNPMENYLFPRGRLIEVFRLLLEEAANEREISICDGLLQAFVGALWREVEAQHYLHPGPTVKSDAPPAANSSLSEQLQSYIRGHLNEPLTIESVAHELFMSRAQLARRIRQETGKTFLELLTAHRMAEARLLLLESEWTAQTIAQFVGFKSPTHFNRLFCRQVGCTPGEFRHQHVKSASSSKIDTEKQPVR